MVSTQKIRVSDEFMDKVYELKARRYGKGKVPPKNSEITKIFAKYLDIERIIKNEFDEI